MSAEAKNEEASAVEAVGQILEASAREESGAEAENKNEPSDDKIPEGEDSGAEPEKDGVADTGGAAQGGEAEGGSGEAGDGQPEADAKLAERAEKLGISSERLKSFGDRAGAFLDVLEEREAAVATNNSAAEKQPETAEDKSFALELPPEVRESLDPDLLKALEGGIGKALSGLREQVKPLGETVKAFRDREAADAKAKETEWFDSEIAKLARDDLFGKGKFSAIKPGTAEDKARQELFKDTQAFVKAGYSREDAFRKASRAALYEAPDVKVQRELAEKARRRQGVHADEPASRKREEKLTPRQEEVNAVAGVLEKYKGELD